MNNALQLDTLEFARKLTDAGVDRRVAEAMVEGLTEASGSELITKADLIDVKAEFSRRLWLFGVGMISVPVASNLLMIRSL